MIARRWVAGRVWTRYLGVVGALGRVRNGHLGGVRTCHEGGVRNTSVRVEVGDAWVRVPLVMVRGGVAGGRKASLGVARRRMTFWRSNMMLHLRSSVSIKSNVCSLNV